MTRSRDIADQQENLGGAVAPFVAGKNKIINGDFGVWQRGTSITGSNGAYTADRFALNHNGSYGTNTVTRQSFTLGNEISGYEAPYFLRWTTATPSGVSYTTLDQRVEDVRTFAGQTVTFSFWAKASSTISSTPYIQFEQYFGSGGSSSVYTTAQFFTITTSWQRFTYTLTVPSITGKTIGTGSFLKLFFNIGVSGFTLDTWGWQIEAGSVATPFTTASGSIGGELALCQRYYQRFNADDSSLAMFNFKGNFYAASNWFGYFDFPTTMRIAPQSVEYSAVGNFVLDDLTASYAMTGIATNTARNTKNLGYIYGSAAGGAIYRPAYLFAASTNAAYIGWSAEL